MIKKKKQKLLKMKIKPQEERGKKIWKRQLLAKVNQEEIIEE